MKESKKYWKGLEELKRTPEFEKRENDEFPEYLPINASDDNDGPTRRDFLKMMGFGVAAVSLAACEAPIKKAIPYVKKPETVDPSIPNYYASTYVSGSDYCSVVVKTREGRPIKVEGNKLSKISGGGTSPQVEASVLSLYDKQRLKNPQISGEDKSWDELDEAVKADLGALNGPLYIVSNTINSPSTNRALELFTSKYTNTKLVSYDQYSFHGALEANKTLFGKRKLPAMDLTQAKTIVAIGADFLGNWPNQTQVNKQYAATRKLGEDKKEMSRLYSFESILSLTGANADIRTTIKPSDEGRYVASLYNLVAGELGAAKLSVDTVKDENLSKAAKDLVKTKGNSVVLAGTNDVNVQILVNGLNSLLGAYHQILDLSAHSNMRAGDDGAFDAFVKDLSAGAGVIFYNCNPVYDHPLGDQIAKALPNVSFSVSTSDRMDETASMVKYSAPDHHYLESWNDFEPVKGSFSLSQPTISNIFNTRQAQDSFLAWADAGTNYYDFLREYWSQNMFPTVNSSDYYNFDSFFDKCLHDGVFELAETAERTDNAVDADIVSGAAGNISSSGSGLELVLYMNSSVSDGIQANNPWLQEMPDPITKACWDNYLTASPKQVEEWGIVLGDMTTQKVDLTVNGQTMSVPVLPQPGQAYGTIGLALGYGRTKAGRVADGVGVNAYPLTASAEGIKYAVTSGVSVTPTADTYRIAQTQTSHTYMGRTNVVQESVLASYQEDPYAGREFPKISSYSGKKKPYAVSLWKGHEYANHHWGMAVDLNSCTGCGTCTIACQTENNVPVVGKEEVLNRREMHWIRIDRYYSSDAEEGDLKAMESAAENPEVTFQPLMCQQCNNAPCETVCPVAATTHSTEGLNQMTYNRCIGTRYCANNCPYKVRRFNWFKYHDNDQFDSNLAMNNDLGKMVLNPDVTVRSRGVMEKCTFCVQRIQYGKLEAKKEGRRPNDSDVNVACASSCPSEALVFGDMKDPNSKVSKLLKLQSIDKGVESQEPRAYHVLEELAVMPNVWYLTKIRNKDKKTEKESKKEVSSHS